MAVERRAGSPPAGDGPPPPNPSRPAFYSLRPGGWRDFVTLLHPPYAAWHLSYVALGAAAAPVLHADRLWPTLVAFLLAVGISAHALDELRDRPLRTRLSDRMLVALAVVSLAVAVGIGIAGLFIVSATLAPFIAAGAFVLVAYNLELFGGRFHSDFWFAAGWGAFPAATGYWVNALGFDSFGAVAAAVLVTSACFALSAVQRRLSTPVRELRRRTVSVTGEQLLEDGSVVELTAGRIAAPLDAALRILALALVLLAAGLVAIRL